MEIIKKEWTESELLDKIMKEKNKQAFLKKEGKTSKDLDLRLSLWQEKFDKVKK